MAAKKESPALLMLTIVAAPIALGFETLLRWFLFPPEFEEIRMFLRPTLAPYAWGIAVLTALFVALGFLLQGKLTRARIARHSQKEERRVRYRIATAVFLLTSNVPQIPAIIATFTFMFGAPIWATLASIAACTVGVVGQAMRVKTFSESTP
jgi:hypothetical protein